MPLDFPPIPLLFFHLAGIAGVVLASDRSLKKYIAIRSLPVPSFVQEDASKPAQPPKVLTRWDRFKKHSKTAGIMLLFIGVSGGIGYAVATYGGRVFQDVFWTLSIGSTSWINVVSMVRIIHNATPETIRFERKTAEGSVSQIHEREDPTSLFNLSRPITLKVVTFLLSASVIASAYVGQYHPFGLFVGTMAFHNVAQMSPAQSNVRRLIKFFSILTSGTAALVLVVVALVNLIQSEKATSPKKDGRVQEFSSPWVMVLMWLWNYVLPVQFPGLLVALALRYDYARSNPSMTTISGDRAVVPARLPPFPKPIFKWSLFSLLASILACHMLNRYTNWFLDQTITVFMMFITFPVVAISTNLAVWLHGDFRSWWVYSESWKPSKEVLAEVDAIREVEKAVEPEEKVDLIDLNEKSDVQ